MHAFYNGDGLRVKKQDFWTPWHDYTWGLGGVLVDSSDGGNGVNNTIVYTPGVSQDVNGSDSFFDVDWLGSTRYLTDSTGNNATAQERYDAFGEVSYTNPSNWDPSNFQWAGDWGYQAEWSASYEPGIGLEYLRNRYYDPAVGRFISADPIGYLGGLNLFSYADNDPVMNLDPSGLRWKERLSLAGGLIGGGVGAIEGVGFGALPGAAWGSGLGGFIGSRLDGESVGRAAVNGVVEGGVTYVGGRLIETGVGAFRGLRAARAARGYVSGFRAIRLRAIAAAAGDQAAAAEIRAAKYLRALGQNVHFQLPGVTRTADFLINGVPYDVYSPVTANANRIIGAIAHKNSQAVGIILDLSRTSVTAEQLGNILARVRGAGAKNIQRIIILH